MHAYVHHTSLGLVDRDHTQGRTVSDGTYKETWNKWHPWHSSHKATKLTVTTCSKREWPWHPFPLHHPCLPRDEVIMERIFFIHLWATCLRSNLYLWSSGSLERKIHKKHCTWSVCRQFTQQSEVCSFSKDSPFQTILNQPVTVESFGISQNTARLACFL